MVSGKRFNPPPGWPTPPEGWTPPAGWLPDPAWPPSPPGWQLWVEEGSDAEAAGFFARRRAEKARVAAQKAEADARTAAQAAWTEWSNVDAEIKDRLEMAINYRGSRSLAEGFVLTKGESAYFRLNGALLIEPKAGPSRYVGGSQGVSIRIAKGVTYRVGQQRGQLIRGEEKPTPIDQGDALVTDKRIVFVGDKATREWAFAKLVGYSHDIDWTGISVSNRQKVSGLMYGTELAEKAQWWIELAIAEFTGQRGELVAELEQELAAHAQRMPPKPAQQLPAGS